MKRCPDCDMDARICRELGGCQVEEREERDPNAAFHAQVLRALGIEEEAPCAVDGCNHGNCEEAARQDAARDDDQWLHDAYDRAGDR